MSENALVTVPFHGDNLEAIQDAEGKVWVSLRRCCENLGVDEDGQRRKLAGKSWAVTNEMLATGPDGKRYQMTMIDLDTLPGWLFSIDARKVKEQVREKLARYQRECARVLADHFFRRTSAGTAPPPEMLAAMVIACQAISQAAVAITESVRELRSGPAAQVNSPAICHKRRREYVRQRFREDPKLLLYSNREIERRIGISECTVRRVRSEPEFRELGRG